MAGPMATGQEGLGGVRLKLRELALKIAIEEMNAGAREIGGNNSGPFVAKYLEGAGLNPPQPWCASFVSWCVREACHRLSINKMPFRYSAAALDLFRRGREAGFEVKGPQPGDIVVWRRGAIATNLGHTGFVQYAHDDVFQTIEGNHTAKVETFHYTLSEELAKPEDHRLVGFVRIP